MGHLISGYTPLDYARLHGVLRGHPLVDEHGAASALYLGRLRPEFPGTDALSMSVHPDALAWVGQWTGRPFATLRSEEHTSELQSLMRNSYAVFCLKKKKPQIK